MIDPSLSKLFPTNNFFEIYEYVYAQAKYYPDFVRVFVPNSPMTVLQAGVEQEEGTFKPTPRAPEDIPEDEKKRSLRRSIRKTQTSIRDYVLCNRFEHFATFTFKDDRQNIARCKQKMNDWLKNEKKRKGKFEYLIVPEFHHDGKSIHFHALILGYAGQLKPAINPNTGKPVIQRARQRFTYPSYTSGFTNVVTIDQNLESYRKVGNYLRKYITKDMPRFSNKNRYWVSHGLAKPYVENNPDPWYVNEKPNKEMKVENGKLFFYDRKDLSHIVKMFWDKA